MDRTAGKRSSRYWFSLLVFRVRYRHRHQRFARLAQFATLEAHRHVNTLVRAHTVSATSSTLTPGCNDNFTIFSFSEIGCQRRTRRGLTSKPSAMCRSSRSTRFAARRESSYTYESLPHESLMAKALQAGRTGPKRRSLLPNFQPSWQAPISALDSTVDCAEISRLDDQTNRTALATTRKLLERLIF